MPVDESGLRLKYCPVCAGRLTTRELGAQGVHPACADCGFVLWLNRKTSVEALIVRGNDKETEILFGRRQDNGLWDLPGNFLNQADRIDETLKRECQREAGLQVEVGEIIGAFEDDFLGQPIISLMYECHVREGTPHPSEPIDELRWFSLDQEIPPVAFASVSEAIGKLKQRRML